MRRLTKLTSILILLLFLCHDVEAAQGLRVPMDGDRKRQKKIIEKAQKILGIKDGAYEMYSMEEDENDLLAYLQGDLKKLFRVLSFIFEGIFLGPGDYRYKGAVTYLTEKIKRSQSFVKK